MCYETKRVLIAVKTYPHPSKKSVESVCTAGITEEGNWIRLYPIPHRFLSDDKQFKVFDWIEVGAQKRPIYKDKRPESYSVISESIRVIKHLDSQKHIAERYKWISMVEKKSLEELKALHENQGVSLGTIQPKVMKGLKLVEDVNEWTDEQKTQLMQLNLFDPEQKIPTLRKVPYKIVCSFECNDPNCTGHNLQLTSWEYNWTVLTLIDQHKDKNTIEKEINNRWMKMFTNKMGYIILGTVNSMEKYGGGGTFIVIGHCSFPKEMQISMCI